MAAHTARQELVRLKLQIRRKDEIP